MTELEDQTRAALAGVALPDVGPDPYREVNKKLDAFADATRQAVYSAIRCELRDERLTDDTGDPEDKGYNFGIDDALAAVNRVEQGTAPTCQVPADRRGVAGFIADRLTALNAHEGVADDGWADRWVADLLPLVSATTEHAARLEHSLKTKTDELRRQGVAFDASERALQRQIDEQAREIDRLRTELEGKQ